MIKTLLIGVVLLFVAVLLMGVRVFFSRKGEFPNTHIGANKALREKGILCAESQDAEIRAKENPVKGMLKSGNV